MSSVSIKKLLLASSALVAVAVLSTPAYAAAVPVVLTGTPADNIWAGAGSGDQTGTAAEAIAGDGPVSLAGHELLVTNDQTADDGSADNNTFSIGIVNNNTAGAGSVNIAQDLGGTGEFSVTIVGIANTGGGASSLLLSNNDTNGEDMTLLIGPTGLDLGGNLTLTNNGLNSTGQTIDMTVMGIAGVDGITTLQAGAGAGDAVSLTNEDSVIYTGAVGLGAGLGANADAVLTLNGANNAFSSLVALIDNGDPSKGQSILNFGTGTSTTTVTVGITGGADGQGIVNLLGSNTLLGAVGTLNSVYAVTAGVAGTTSSITGAVDAEFVSIYGVNNGAAGSITFGNTLTAEQLLVQSAGTTTAQAESATVTGNTTVADITGVVAGAFAGANASLTLNGANNTLTGATNLIATTAGTAATINFNGAANTLTGLVTLADAGTGSSGGQAILNFGAGGGGADATVTTGITGSGANQGTVNLLGANVITGAIGTTHAINALNAGVQGTTSSVSGAVNAQTVTISGGANVAATGTTNFGSTLTVGTGGMTVSSAGTSAAQVENSTVTGVFTNTGALNIVAGAGAGAHASLTLNGATNTISGVTTLNDGGGNATLNVGNGASVTFTGGIVGDSTNEGTLALAGSSTIAGQVGSSSKKLKAITLAGAGTDAFTGDVFATTLAYGASNSTVQIADGKNLTAAITATNTGTLTLQGTSTVTGQVGAGGARLSTINAGVTGKTSTFSNDVFVTTLNVGGGNVALNGDTSGNLVFGSASGQTTLASGKTLAGNINGTGGTAGAGIGNVVLAGTNTITGQVGNTGILKTLTLNGSGTTHTVTSAAIAVNAADITTLGSNTLAIGTNNFTLGAGQTLASTITTAAAYGKVTSTGTTNVAATSKVDLTVSATGYLPTTTFTLISGGAGTVNALNAGGLTVNGVNSGASQTLTLGAITYTQAGVGSNQLQILATNNGAASVTTTNNNTSVAEAMDTIAGTGDAALQQVQSRIATAPTAAAVNAILGALTPTIDGGSQQVSKQVVKQVQDITGTRMAALRAEDGMSGVSGGASDTGVSVWVQGYGANGTQDADSTPGYDASTFGTAIGVDSENIIENGLVGIAVNYGTATVDSSNLNTTATDVDSIGATLYGVTAVGERSFIEGQLSYGRNDISSIRHDVGGIVGNNANGSTTSDQYGGRVTYGRDFDRWLLADVIATPEITAGYNYVNTQGYTETGPGANLVVGDNSQSNFDLGIGGRLAWSFRNEDGSVFKPVVRARYFYAVANDSIDSTSTFAGAAPGNNPTFVTQGADPDPNSLTLGLGVTYLSTADWDLTANYDFEYRPDYSSNAGTLRATKRFSSYY